MMCDNCPGAYHEACIQDKQGYVPTQGTEAEAEATRWLCPECVNGTKPSAGDVVWAKCGTHKFWPAYIRAEDDIPEPLQRRKRPPVSFAVYFFGTNECAWMDQFGTVAWEAGDHKGRFSTHSGSGKKLKLFKQAVAEGYEAYLNRVQLRTERCKEIQEGVKTHAPSFKKVVANKWTCKRPPSGKARKEVPQCGCTADDVACAGDSCWNRCMYYECDPKTCPAGAKCGNCRMQKRQSPKGLRSYPTPGKGHGLQADEAIEAGDFVIEYCGEVITAEECASRLTKQGKQGLGAFYMITLDNDHVPSLGLEHTVICVCFESPMAHKAVAAKSHGSLSPLPLFSNQLSLLGDRRGPDR